MKVLFFTPDTIHKSDRFSQAFPEEDFKLFPNNGYSSIVFDLILVLLPMEEDLVSRKKGCKRYTFVVFDLYYFEIVFTLLIEVVVFYE